MSKSNSSINIYKENLNENKENYFLNNNLFNRNKRNFYKNKLIKLKKSQILNPGVTLNNLTLSLQNLQKKTSPANLGHLFILDFKVRFTRFNRVEPSVSTSL